MEAIDKEVQLVGEYKELFNTEVGKSVLFDLMRACNMLSVSASKDTWKTFYHEGRRSVILYILEKIDTDPEDLRKYMQKMLDEDRRLEEEY